MPVVSDTSPLLGLAAIEQLELLHEQFGAVFIPAAVLAELKLEYGFRGAGLLSKALSDGWLEVKAVKNLPLVKSLSLELHSGEAETLALAMDLDLEMVVMDEHDGRMRARAMGLKTIGVLGILLRAKKQGSILSLAEAMQALRREIGFFISDDLYDLILREAAEE
jgi:predicted nucleic acid-binding protein